MNKLRCFIFLIICLFFIQSASASDAADCIDQLFKEHKKIVSMLDEGSYDEGYALAQAAYARGNRLAGHEICMLPLIPRYKGKVGSVEASAKVCRALAMTGDAIMQEMYVRILSSGLVEQKNKNDEVYFTKEAALGGMSWAQGKLAIRYGRGEGVPKDYVQSYVFGSLAYSQGFEPGKAVVDLLEANLPQQTILEAQRMAREFVPRSGYRQFKGEIDCAK